ncbi:putative alpha-L-fucosidase isoform X2 [Mya arenaria]|uniref:putative alpha-L-fucosidase isoform X2 n=1 Tax=Mya arenaria TaxID=6604 RepID=UPI0022E39C12|nr:putative alpha-L-fucosidase isoform X2 [Mya arenaria]
MSHLNSILRMCIGYKLPIYLLFVTLIGLSAQYAPNWASLDTRPLPNWYDEGKIGIFVVWGLYAVPALQNEWFWEMWHDQHNEEIVKYMQDNYKPDFTYQDFAAEFTADLFDPEDWADIFNASGAK